MQDCERHLGFRIAARGALDEPGCSFLQIVSRSFAGGTEFSELNLCRRNAGIGRQLEPLHGFGDVTFDAHALCQENPDVMRRCRVPLLGRPLKPARRSAQAGRHAGALRVQPAR